MRFLLGNATARRITTQPPDERQVVIAAEGGWMTGWLAGLRWKEQRRRGDAAADLLGRLRFMGLKRKEEVGDDDDEGREEAVLGSSSVLCC